MREWERGALFAFLSHPPISLRLCADHRVYCRYRSRVAVHVQPTSLLEVEFALPSETRNP